MTELHTPGSLTVKVCVSETPKSIRGSSIFSPGEAFWNEAIQVADGLCAPQAAEETHSAMGCHVLNSCNLRNGVCNENSMKKWNEVEKTAWNMELSVLGSLGKHAKDLDKEVSPLPVKHFDFSCEGKNLDESTSLHHGVDGSKCATHKGREQSECGSVNIKGPETSNILFRCGKAHSDEKLHEVQEMSNMTSTIAINKEAGGMSCPDNGDMTSNSPVNEIKKSVHESDEASTPSSFVRLEDRTDLHSWLPSEICSIYIKRGISKLYPWQVVF